MNYSENPLDKISDFDFKEFLIAKENDFHKITEFGIVTIDFYKWYDTYNKLQWYCYFNHQKILKEKNVTLSKTSEIMDLLISERLNNIKNN